MSGQLLAIAVGAISVALLAAPFLWSGIASTAGMSRVRQSPPRAAGRRW